MINNKPLYHFFTAIIFLIISFSSFAQAVGIRTDRNQILIGERIKYELLITLPSPGYSINFRLPDSIPHFEMLQKGRIDSLNSNGVLSLHQQVIFTSFDSGLWYIPSFPVVLQKNNNYKRFATDSVLVNVGYSPADSTNELRDIKPIIEIEVVSYYWYYIAGAIILLFLITFFLYRYFKKRKNSPDNFMHSALSAYDEAMNDLKKLSEYNTGNPDGVKRFHTELNFIFKRYYSRFTKSNLLNKTTGDFLLKLKEQDQQNLIIADIAQSLRTGDAVKFAKYFPTVAESEICKTLVRDTIEKIEKTST